MSLCSLFVRYADDCILAAAVQPFSGQDIEEVFQSMSSDDCLRVWDALVKHVPPDFDVESQVGMPTRFIQDVCAN